MPVGIKPKQSLGQNFLIDPNIVRKIVRSFNPDGQDVVVEIGPGLGALTAQLLDRVHHLIVIDIDRRIVEELRSRFVLPNLTIVHEDFLETDLRYWQKKFGRKLRLIGNLPYHLTSPILFKVFDERLVIRDLTVMVQREVAGRIVATPGTKAYGILSVLAQFYTEPSALFDVSPNCFYPKPRVTSTVVRLRQHDPLPYRIDEDLFRTVVRTTFGKRRKTLRNSLRYLPFDEEIRDNIIEGVDFPKQQRPEQLSVDDFVRLTEGIQSFVS